MTFKESHYFGEQRLCRQGKEVKHSSSLLNYSIQELRSLYSLLIAPSVGRDPVVGVWLSAIFKYFCASPVVRIRSYSNVFRHILDTFKLYLMEENVGV